MRNWLGTKETPISVNAALAWLFYSDKIGAQLAVIISAFCWTIALILPSCTMCLPRYAFMGELMNDAGWALMFSLSLFLQCFGLYTRNRWSLIVAGSLAVTLHSIAALNFIVPNWGVTVPAAISSEVAIIITAALTYIFVPSRRVSS